MRGHTGLHGETLPTDVTHIGTLSTVHPQVSDQIGLPAKAGITFITLVRLGVNLLVNSLVTGSSEGLGTMFTFEFLGRVFPLRVTLEPLLGTELTATCLTAIFLRSRFGFGLRLLILLLVITVIIIIVYF